MSQLVEFYSIRATDNKGRQLDQILAWDDDKLETVHDYIQWVFPTDTPSAYNPAAPLLTDEDIAEFNRSKTLQNNLRTSFERYLEFLGFSYDEGEIERREDFAQKAKNWLTPHNHNYLRISRVLRCLDLCGLRTEAEQFLQALSEVYRENREVIGERTMNYWSHAYTAA